MCSPVNRDLETPSGIRSSRVAEAASQCLPCGRISRDVSTLSRMAGLGREQGHPAPDPQPPTRNKAERGQSASSPEAGKFLWGKEQNSRPMGACGQQWRPGSSPLGVPGTDGRVLSPSGDVAWADPSNFSFSLPSSRLPLLPPSRAPSPPSSRQPEVS